MTEQGLKTGRLSCVIRAPRVLTSTPPGGGREGPSQEGDVVGGSRRGCWGRAHEWRAAGSWEPDRVGAVLPWSLQKEPALPTPWFQPSETRWSF